MEQQKALSIDYFSTVKRYYDLNIYSKDDVAIFVQYNKITSDQYTLITGDPYIAS